MDLAQGEQIPTEVIDALTDECVCKWAFNAQFERVCLSRWLRRNGYPLRNERYAAPDDPCMAYLNPAGWHCTMVWSAYLGLPLSSRMWARRWGWTSRSSPRVRNSSVFLCAGQGCNAAHARVRPGEVGNLQGL